MACTRKRRKINFLKIIFKKINDQKWLKMIMCKKKYVVDGDGFYVMQHQHNLILTS